MQYFRTFIALPVKAGEDLMELRHEIKTALAHERISWVDPANFHITLRFLGDTSPGDVEKISVAMKGSGFIQNASSAPVTGVKSFGPAKKPRVIWAAFGQEQWFKELNAELNIFLKDLGLASQNQEFTPHLTLGRIRSLQDVSGYHAFMQGIKARACEAIYMDRIIYYRSIIGSNGPKYTRLSQILLKKA